MNDHQGNGGAAGFWTRFDPAHQNMTRPPQQFVDDLIPLLNGLVSDKLGHPYDGITAGTIA